MPFISRTKFLWWFSPIASVRRFANTSDCILFIEYVQKNITFGVIQYMGPCSSPHSLTRTPAKITRFRLNAAFSFFVSSPHILTLREQVDRTTWRFCSFRNPFHMHAVTATLCACWNRYPQNKPKNRIFRRLLLPSVPQQEVCVATLC